MKTAHIISTVCIVLIGATSAHSFDFFKTKIGAEVFTTANAKKNNVEEFPVLSTPNQMYEADYFAETITNVKGYISGREAVITFDYPQQRWSKVNGQYNYMPASIKWILFDPSGAEVMHASTKGLFIPEEVYEFHMKSLETAKFYEHTRSKSTLTILKKTGNEFRIPFNSAEGAKKTAGKVIFNFVLDVQKINKTTLEVDWGA